MPFSQPHVALIQPGSLLLNLNCSPQPGPWIPTTQATRGCRARCATRTASAPRSTWTGSRTPSPARAPRSATPSTASRTTSPAARTGWGRRSRAQSAARASGATTASASKRTFTKVVLKDYSQVFFSIREYVRTKNNEGQDGGNRIFNVYFTISPAPNLAIPHNSCLYLVFHKETGGGGGNGGSHAGKPYFGKWIDGECQSGCLSGSKGFQ